MSSEGVRLEVGVPARLSRNQSWKSHDSPDCTIMPAGKFESTGRAEMEPLVGRRSKLPLGGANPDDECLARYPHRWSPPTAAA